jgi:hypothetical protein
VSIAVSVARTEQQPAPSSPIVVSLRICTWPPTIDRELGILFEPIDCSVYLGRQLLGRYCRIGVGRISAFDSRGGLWLGDYRNSKKARHAICHRWNLSKHSVDVCVLEIGDEQ